MTAAVMTAAVMTATVMTATVMTATVMTAAMTSDDMLPAIVAAIVAAIVPVPKAQTARVVPAVIRGCEIPIPV